MNKKVTPWYSAKVKPARNGWYEVRYFITPKHQSHGLIQFAMRYFLNGEWFMGIEGLFIPSLFGMGKINDGESWRGLAKEPK